MRVDDLRGQLRRAVRSHLHKQMCRGCNKCQRVNAGRTGKGAALRLAVRAREGR